MGEPSLILNFNYMRGGFMSTKQFISAEEHLAKLGITVQQAFNFIAAKVREQDADAIFIAARQTGVTVSMLEEITKVSANVINDYFAAANWDSKLLDQTSILFNTDIGTLESLVDFNDNVGMLSTASLREEVKSMINFEADYPFVFTERRDFQSNDGIYDASELGVSKFGNIAASDENIESIFYGTWINIFSVIDKTELDQIRSFPMDGSSEIYQMLLSDVLSDTPAVIAWTEEELADLVINAAALNHNAFIDSDDIGGTLELSLIGQYPIHF